MYYANIKHQYTEQWFKKILFRVKNMLFSMQFLSYKTMCNEFKTKPIKFE